MKGLALLLAASTLTLPISARASWFEYCDIEGEIREVAPTDAKRTYAITVLVNSSARAKLQGNESYSDCSEHLGETMQVKLKLPRKVGSPANGDHLLFYRTAADCFGPNGDFIGQCISNRFLRLRKTQAAPAEA